MAVKDLTFTCSLGVFTFGSNVRLSHAKLLRDTISGQFFNPKTNSKKLRTEEDIYNYQETLPPLLADIDFDVEIRRTK